jgi:uncharacterized protein (DUF427 family)
MKEKQVKLPGSPPIFVHSNQLVLSCPSRGRVVADTRNALRLREAAYPPVQD